MPKLKSWQSNESKVHHYRSYRSRRGSDAIGETGDRDRLARSQLAANSKTSDKSAFESPPTKTSNEPGSVP